ncbi:hypothetical protein MLD38_009611 [Melastoma candidum]|uniref:Uncharacterized protein n=1 Tax=Melastoma candidum TaxID=119954 RepID=A0ACB9RZL1_9MYRT|nr:hypothetical protein MLD38_009611 [Melastoma candidum]
MAVEGRLLAAPRSLQETPTWALATVCFVFISLSIFIEHLIHLLCHWLKRHRKAALHEAVEKLKTVLMLLGFMSLTLAVTQNTILKICIPTHVANTMLPCRRTITTKTTKHPSMSDGETALPIERRLASDAAGFSGDDHCIRKGMTSLISVEGMNQLSIFIFVLAVMQIVYSVLTMALGRAKMKRWKGWEEETRTTEYQAANDPNRFRFTRQTTFGRRHMGACTETSSLLWTKCFFRQFFHSVAKVDYLTLRHGFIAAHLSANSNFNFQRYIQRSLEDDFKVVVGISPFMWFVVVIFMLMDVHGWEVYLWVSFIPLTIVLVLGTKLEVIVARMALQLKSQNTVIKGTPLVQPNDNLFWFSHPKYVLTLLHFTLFMNAFELAFFIWVTTQFGFKSCYHEHLEIIIVRVVLAVIVQVLCSYITLPLYALVTQMGSRFKSAALEEDTANVIRKWHAGVREKRKKQQGSSHGTRDSSSSHIRGGSVETNSDFSSTHYRSPTFGDTITQDFEEETDKEGTSDSHERRTTDIEGGSRDRDSVRIELTEVDKVEEVP